MTTVVSFLGLVYPHALAVFTLVVVWRLAIRPYENRFSLRATHRPRWRQRSVKLLVIAVLCTIALHCLLFQCSWFVSPPWSVTLAVLFLAVTADLFWTCYERYWVFWGTHGRHVGAVVGMSVLVLSASMLIVVFLRTPLERAAIDSGSPELIPQTKMLSPRLLTETRWGYGFISPGTLFAFLAGTATLVAFLLTIVQLHAQHTRLTTYKHYLRESSNALGEVIKSARRAYMNATVRLEGVPPHDKKWNDAKSKSQERHQIKMVCFTPLHGNVSLPEGTHELDEYRSQLDALCSKELHDWVDVEVVCLTYKEGQMPFFESFESYGDYRDAKKPKKEADSAPPFPLSSREVDEQTLLDSTDCDLAQLYLGFSDRRDFRKPKEPKFLALRHRDAQWYIYQIKRWGGDVRARKRTELPTFHFLLAGNVAVVGDPLRLPPPHARGRRTLSCDRNSSRSKWNGKSR